MSYLFRCRRGADEEHFELLIAAAAIESARKSASWRSPMQMHGALDACATLADAAKEAKPASRPATPRGTQFDAAGWQNMRIFELFSRCAVSRDCAASDRLDVDAAASATLGFI